MFMTVSQLRSLLAETGMSPEQLGKALQVSGMTLRRLLKKPDHTSVPEAYRPHFESGVYSLIINNRLNPESAAAASVLSLSRNLSFEAAIRSLGFPQEAMAMGGDHQEKLIIGLSQIGASEARQGEVENKREQVSGFRRLGEEWKERLNALLKVLGTTKLSRFEKFAAYGALFYLLTPFDLIPDGIPVFGMVDDFAILGIVVAYYLQRFPKLFS
jgi:uncharacterized membrane protein YkvA (DUF1232 family)